MKYVRMYTDDDGETHFEDVEVATAPQEFAPPTEPVHVSDPAPAARILFVRIPCGWFGDWHATPKRQFNTDRRGTARNHDERRREPDIRRGRGAADGRHDRQGSPDAGGRRCRRGQPDHPDRVTREVAGDGGSCTGRGRGTVVQAATVAHSPCVRAAGNRGCDGTRLPGLGRNRRGRSRSPGCLR